MRRPPVYIVEKGKKIGMNHMETILNINLGFIYWRETSFTKAMFKIILEKHRLNFGGIFWLYFGYPNPSLFTG